MQDIIENHDFQYFDSGQRTQFELFKNINAKNNLHKGSKSRVSERFVLDDSPVSRKMVMERKISSNISPNSKLYARMQDLPLDLGYNMRKFTQLYSRPKLECKSEMYV